MCHSFCSVLCYCALGTCPCSASYLHWPTVSRLTRLILYFLTYETALIIELPQVLRIRWDDTGLCKLSFAIKCVIITFYNSVSSLASQPPATKSCCPGPLTHHSLHVGGWVPLLCSHADIFSCRLEGKQLLWFRC